MAYAPGIVLRPWTVGGTTTTEAGEALFTRAKITASRSLMLWGATGWRYESATRTITSTEGAQVSGDLPVCDQGGWRTEGNAIIDVSVPGSYTHTYTIKVTQFRKDASGREIPVGEERTYANVFIPTGDLSPFDLDLMQPVATVAGGVVLVPGTWDVKVAAAEAAAVAAEASAAEAAATIDPLKYASASTAANTRRFLDRLNRGIYNVSLLYIGDSTGNENSEHVYLEAVALGQKFPTHTVTIRLWDAAGGLDYAAPVTIQTGTGTRTLTVWNCSVSGEAPPYVLGSRWANAIVQAKPDLVIVSHSHNTGDPGDPANESSTHGNRNGFLQLTEEVAATFPTAGMILTAQNPTTMAGRETWQAKKADALQEISALRGYGFIDVHQAFVDSGNVAGLLLADGVHPNAAGSALWADVVMAALGLEGTAASIPLGTPPLLTSAQNFLPNGDFTPWAGASPDGWELVNATTAKETTLYESGMWGCRIAPVADGAAHIQRTITVAALGNKGIIAGQVVTLAVRVYAATAHAASARVSLLDDTGGTYATNADLGNIRGRYTWLFATKRIQNPNNAIYARIVARTSGTGVVDFVADRAYIIRGVLPNVG